MSHSTSNKQTTSTEDPIVALASGQGASAIALIRLSGPRSHTLLQPFLKKTPKALRQATLTDFMDSEGTVIDNLLALYFAEGASFTGEESAELHCHGSPYIVRKILGLLEASGFRMAEPGEFTKRAYLNGNLDLTQAEGIKELVSAQTEAQWYAARELAKGSLSSLVTNLRKKLIHAMSYLEARIDFPDEEEPTDVDLPQVTALVEEVRSVLAKLANSYESGQIAANGLRVSLVGEPNAGKSTLLNTLLGKDRAIVTDIAGTTRDYIEESCVINGQLVRLIDTAGIRLTDDVVEKLGVEQSHRLARESDLVLVLLPANLNETEVENFLVNNSEIPAEKRRLVLTKADLGTPTWAGDMLQVSCASESGLDELRDYLAATCKQHFENIKGNPFVINTRHLTALDQCRTALDAYMAAAEARSFDECLAFELQSAATKLHSIIGEIDTEDLLDRIFSDFCIGK